MDAGHFLAFLAVATLLTIIPGPDMALVTRNVLRDGVAAGLVTSAGILSGILVWASLAAFGLAALLTAWAAAFTLVKLAGAAYLVFLGLTTLRTAGRSVTQPGPGGGPPTRLPRALTSEKESSATS